MCRHKFPISPLGAGFYQLPLRTFITSAARPPSGIIECLLSDPTLPNFYIDRYLSLLSFTPSQSGFKYKILWNTCFRRPRKAHPRQSSKETHPRRPSFLPPFGLNGRQSRMKSIVGTN